MTIMSKLSRAELAGLYKKLASSPADAESVLSKIEVPAFDPAAGEVDGADALTVIELQESLQLQLSRCSTLDCTLNQKKFDLIQLEEDVEKKEKETLPQLQKLCRELQTKTKEAEARLKKLEADVKSNFNENEEVQEGGGRGDSPHAEIIPELERMEAAVKDKLEQNAKLKTDLEGLITMTATMRERTERIQSQKKCEKDLVLAIKKQREHMVSTRRNELDRKRALISKYEADIKERIDSNLTESVSLQTYASDIERYTELIDKIAEGAKSRQEVRDKLSERNEMLKSIVTGQEVVLIQTLTAQEGLIKEIAEVEAANAKLSDACKTLQQQLKALSSPRPTPGSSSSGTS